MKMIKVFAYALRDLAVHYKIATVERGAEHFLWVIQQAATQTPMRGWDQLALMIVAAVVWITPFWWMFERRLARGAHYRHRVTIRIEAALSHCADTYREQPGERGPRLRDLDRVLEAAEDAILRAHRYAGTIRRRSARRGVVRHHAALVVGALRAETLRIDVEPDTALPRLGAMLATISERSAEGRIGALLSPDVLTDVTPVSAARTKVRESLHVAFVILIAMVAAVAASLVLPSTGVRSELQPWLTLGCAVLAAIVVGGWHRVGRILELAPGK
ncbi:hypothetical protein ACFVX6_31250 [Streptomyces sp. NPDC058289]|uniref:hypothetical protein n=1 Tax=Streptomyces sp. NPDC058289 TaxID=3346425 RepID=UPI0036E410AF